MQNQLRSLAPLSYPVRINVVAKYLGFILLVSSGLLLVPLIASILWQEFMVTLRYGVVGGLFLVLGFSSLFITRPKSLQSNEAYVIIALAFVIGSLGMVYPLMGAGLNFVDAWFESVSGLTTTGLSVANFHEIDPKTFFFARAWMQWYGGLGIIVFGVSLAFLPGTISKAFVKKMVYKDDDIENSKIFARKILLIYSAITVLGVLMLFLSGLDLIDAVELTFSAISTGGFSPFPDSLEGLPRLTQSFVCVLSFLGALSFPLFWIMNIKSLKKLVLDIQFLGLIICILFFTILVYVLYSTGWADTLINVIQIQTTSGFSTIDVAEYNPGIKFLLLASMLIGGGTLSTAGGIKLLRVVIILQALRFLFFRTSLASSSVISTKQSPEIINCLSVFTIYVIVIFASTFIFVAMGAPLLDALFNVVSAIGTAGYISGPPVADLPAILKIVLGIDMLLGRLECVTLLVLFYPRTLIGRRNIL